MGVYVCVCQFLLLTGSLAGDSWGQMDRQMFRVLRAPPLVIRNFFGSLKIEFEELLTADDS